MGGDSSGNPLQQRGGTKKLNWVGACPHPINFPRIVKRHLNRLKT